MFLFIVPVYMKEHTLLTLVQEWSVVWCVFIYVSVICICSQHYTSLTILNYSQVEQLDPKVFLFVLNIYWLCFQFLLYILVYTDLFYNELISVTFCSRKISQFFWFESFFHMDGYTFMALKNLFAVSYLVEKDIGDACLFLSGGKKTKKEIKGLLWDAKPHIHPQADLVPEFILLVCSKKPS